MTYSFLYFDKDSIVFFGESIIGTALKTTKELIFTKRMIVDRLADSIVHFDHYRTLMVKYKSHIPITQSTGLKNYALKNKNWNFFYLRSWQPAKWPAIAPGQLTHLCMGLVNHYCCQTCKSQLWPTFKSPRALQWATTNK